LFVLLQHKPDAGGTVYYDINPEVAKCLVFVLNYIEEPREETLNCLVCDVLHSLLKHFTNCEETVNIFASKNGNVCHMCLKIFALICSHVHDCLNNNRSFSIRLGQGQIQGIDQGQANQGQTGDVEAGLDENQLKCDLKLCLNIKQLLKGQELGSQIKMVWHHARKMLGCLLDGISLEGLISQKTPDLVKTRGMRNRKISRAPPSALVSIPEARPLSPQPNQAPAETATVAAEGDEEMVVCSRPELVSQSDSDDETQSDALPTGHVQEAVSSPSSSNCSGDYTSGPTNKGRMTSLQPGRVSDQQYFTSVKDRPTGIKGIGRCSSVLSVLFFKYTYLYGTTRELCVYIFLVRASSWSFPINIYYFVPISGSYKEAYSLFA